MKSLIAFIFIVYVIFTLFLILPYNTKDTYIYINQGETLLKVSEELKNQKLIISKDLFILLFLLLNETPKAGYYKIEKNSNLINIFLKISKGKQDLIKVIIIPGDDLFSISKKLEMYGIIKKENFLNFFNNKFKLLSIGFPYDNFEGFIIPDTYFLEKNTSPKRVFHIFYNKFIRTYKKADREFYKKMIIASIIEKEAKTTKDKYLISSVIHNRLNKKLPLQIDATLLYMAKKLNIKEKQIKELKLIQSPYNTYKKLGLPPTPICSFSKESLNASFNPEKTDYLFYFTKDGKTHIFSKDYKQHLKKLKSKW